MQSPDMDNMEMMDPSRVDHLVNRLASALETALELYTKWKQRLESEHHYRRQKTASSTSSQCAVSTSLDMSAYRIRSTYQIGSAFIGPDFASGSDECRTCLAASLDRVEGHVAHLRHAIRSKHRLPVNLHEVYLASEEARTKCVTALAEHYRRLASGRPVPPELPIPRPGPSAALRRLSVMSQTAPPQSPHPPPIRVLPPPPEFDSQTAIWSTTSEPPTFQSEPPSPPLTPKLPMSASADDLESVVTSDVTPRQGRRSSLRPANSVFSIFCPEAMALQVDPARPLPGGGLRTRCACGYKWQVMEAAERADFVALRDGFKMTRRFLAKSHCDQQGSAADEGVAVGPEPTTASGGKKPKYGCVLCASRSGRTDTYESVEELRAHVNEGHDKWQMLHDRDMS